MGGHEGGRWDVGVDSGAVYVERISEDDKSLFEDSLEPEEARQLGGLLTKYADKAQEAGEDEQDDDESAEDDDSDKSDDKSDDSDKSDDESDDADDSEDSDKSED
jgi:hypothetical protein